MKHSFKKAAQAALTTTPLPVLDILNNIITITNYLSAVQSASLPSVITSDPTYATLATEYTDWQYLLWEQYFEGLVNGNILAQAQEINNLITDKITDQNVFMAVTTPKPATTPSVLLSCDEVASRISDGLPYVSQLQTIADSIKNADQQKIDELNKIIDQLNKEFDDMEQQLTDDAIDNSKTVVVTVINVGVAVATEEDPISPLVEGVAQVGTDIIKELLLSSQINAVLSQLEDAWNQLDQVTIQLAQINLIINRLNQIVSETSETVTALNNIVNDWQTICDTINEPSGDWATTGLPQVTEWADRMSRVSFYTNITQTVN